MWDDTDNRGGFMSSSQSQFNSPGVLQRKPQQSQNLAHVTIRQILHSSEDGIKIGDLEVSMIVVVGLVESLERSATKIVYKVRDETGYISAVHWIDTDSDGSDVVTLPLKQYAKFIGTVRTQQNSKHIMVFKAEPIIDPNEITVHILEVIHQPLKINRLQKKEMQRTDVSSNNALPNSMMDMSNMGSEQQMSGLTSKQVQVLQCVKRSKDVTGQSRINIYSELKVHMQPREIDNILEFLSTEGHIYSTIDDDHYQVVDGAF